MKVLLTGGAGFIGRSVHDQLAAAGHAIRVFDRALDQRDDIIDHDRLAAAASGCDSVIHLAAKVGLGVSIRDIDAYALHNDYGTAMALRAAAEVGISRFLYASSMVVYGEGRYCCAEHAPFVRHRAVGRILTLGASTRCARSAALTCVLNWCPSRQHWIRATLMRQRRRTVNSWRQSGAGRPKEL